MHGTLRVILADALFPVTAIITVSFLARWLGPADYGLFVLCVTVITWVEFSVTSFFAHATIKLTGEAVDWKPIGAKVTQLYLLVSVGTMLLVWILAGAIATLLREPALTAYLRLFSFDIPVVAMAASHRHVLMGIGDYREAALSTAGRWIARMVLIVSLVGLGLSVQGAILGIIGASLVELAIVRFYLRPPLLRSSAFPVRRLFSFAAPIFLSSLSLRLFRLDLVALKVLGGTAEQTGFYGAAQRLSDVLVLFGQSISRLLLSTLTRAVRDGERAQAQVIARNAVRFVIMLLPLAGMVAGAAPEIVSLILGPRFIPAAPIVAMLIFGAVGIIMIAMNQAVLIAADKPKWTTGLTGPMVPVAIVGHVLLIPLLGAMGAAIVTTSVACLIALASTIAVYRVFGVLPPAATVCRSALISGLSYALATLWPTPDFWVLIKLAFISLTIPASYLLLREMSTDEMNFLRSVLRADTVSAEVKEEPSEGL